MNGELALEDQNGLQIQGKEELALLAQEWQYGGGLIPDVSYRREAFHVMLSMSPGADVKAVYFAARAFAREEFVSHKCVLVLHDPASDPDSHRPHVHLIVRAQGRDGQRLNPRKAELARWRQDFADRLMERGVAASATRRQTRGVLQPTRKLGDYHRGATQRKEWPMHQGAGAQRTEQEVLMVWRHVADALCNSEESEDRDLGRQVADFAGGMQTVARSVRQYRQRRKWLEREHEIQASVSRDKEKNPELLERSQERYGRWLWVFQNSRPVWGVQRTLPGFLDCGRKIALTTHSSPTRCAQAVGRFAPEHRADWRAC